MPPQRHHVTGGRQVPGRRQAVGVDEIRPGHAQRLGGAVHAPGKGRLRPLDRLADGRGRIVGRFDRGGADQVAQGDGLAGSQAKLRRRFSGRVLRDRHPAVERNLAMLDRLERDVERHHLGQRGGVETGIGVLRPQHLARAHVHDQFRIGNRAGNYRVEKQHHKDRCKHANATDALPRTSKHLSHCSCLVTPIFCRDLVICGNDSTEASGRKQLVLKTVAACFCRKIGGGWA